MFRFRILCVLALASCGGGDHPAGTDAGGDAGGGSLAAVGENGVITTTDLPDTQVGGISAATVTVMNSGSAPTGALAVTVSGDDFALDPATTTCTNLALAAGARCTVGITFHPSAAGDRTGTLAISAEPGGSFTVGLTGTAALADIQITGGPGPGLVPLQTAARTTWQLVNSGSTAVAIENIEITGGSAWGLVSKTCGATLAGMSSCEIVSSFYPMFVGETGGRVEATVAGTLYVADIDATGAWYVSVGVSGNGRVTSSPAGIDCPGVCESLFSEVVLTAVADPGNHLVRWDAPCGTGPTCSPPIGRLQPAVYVYFEPGP